VGSAPVDKDVGGCVLFLNAAFSSVFKVYEEADVAAKVVGSIFLGKPIDGGE